MNYATIYSFVKNIWVVWNRKRQHKILFSHDFETFITAS